MRLLFVTAATVFLFAAPVTAGQESEPKAESKEDSAEAKKQEKVCRRVAMQMGSRKKERVCMTREEWIEFNRGQ